MALLREGAEICHRDDPLEQYFGTTKNLRGRYMAMPAFSSSECTPALTNSALPVSHNFYRDELL